MKAAASFSGTCPAHEVLQRFAGRFDRRHGDRFRGFRLGRRGRDLGLLQGHQLVGPAARPRDAVRILALGTDDIAAAHAACERRGIAVAPYDDTIVMSFDLDAGLHGHGMDELAATHLSHACIAFKDVVGTGKKALGFHEVDLRAATRYAAEDADVTLRLWRRFKPRLAFESVTTVYEMVDRPLVGVIAGMERAGVKLFRDCLISPPFAIDQRPVEIETHCLYLKTHTHPVCCRKKSVPAAHSGPSH